MKDSRTFDSLEEPRITEGFPRSVEAAAALAGLLLTAPLIILSALAIVLSSPGPAFFLQERRGRNGRLFLLCKLRTMRVGGDGPQVTASGDGRITQVGKLLRMAKVDELPELWNVLRGEMALVGPRPEVPRYVDLENPLWHRVLEARPGITDPVTLRLRNEEVLLAEVRGNREKFYLETLQPFKLRGYLEYLTGRNWWIDLKVLCKTCYAVIVPEVAPPPTVWEILTSSFVDGNGTTLSEDCKAYESGLIQHRRARRFRVAWNVKIEVMDDSGNAIYGTGSLENVSLSGALVYLKRYLQRGTKLSLWINVPFKRCWVRFSAEVVRLQSVSLRAGVAVRFTTMRPTFEMA